MPELKIGLNERKIILNASNSDELKFSKSKDTRRKTYTLDERRQMVQTESNLQSKCEEYLSKTGWVKPGAISEVTELIKGIYTHIPNQVFGGHMAKAANSALKNLPDLILFHPDGRCKMFELKSKSGKSMRGQRAFAKHIPVEEIKVFDGFAKSVERWYLDI